MKTVCFSDDLETLIPETSDEDMIDPEEVVNEIAAVLGPAIEQADKSVRQRLLDEELVEIDTTLRVPVPAVEDVRPTPPWEHYANGENTTRSLKSQRRLMAETLDGLAQSEKKWSGLSRLEKELQWLPFSTHLGKPKADGDFDDGSLARYLAELNLDGDVHLERLTWKPDGLRLLDNDEFEDDELDTVDFESEVDMSNVDIIDTAPPALPLLPRTVPQCAVAPVVPKVQTPSAQGWSSMDALLQKRKIQLDVANAPLNNQSDLDMFARVQGLSNAAVETTASLLPSGLKIHQPPMKMAPVVEATSATAADTSREVSIPTPDFEVPAEPLQVIMSINLMQNHQFVRRLQKLLPTIDLIERDFTSFPADTAKQPRPASSSSEADITISPGTGLMFTNLQKLKQQALPGQASSFGIREQISAIASRYERLVVLVGDRPTMDDGQALLHLMDASDSDALAELINQTAVLETDVEVVYVAGGLDKLVKWAAAAISRNAASNHNLLREETLWERFLREAGMNAYAAQAVVAAMQSPTSASDPVSDSSQTLSSVTAVTPGLARFVTMSAEDRVQQFGPMMGGDRVLRRVNRVLDAGWLPSL